MYIYVDEILKDYGTILIDTYGWAELEIGLHRLRRVARVTFRAVAKIKSRDFGPGRKNGNRGLNYSFRLTGHNVFFTFQRYFFHNFFE
jgi:hypothetical protein